MHDQGGGRQGRRRLLGRRGVAALGHLQRHPDPLQLRHAQPAPRLPPHRGLRGGGLPLLPGLPAPAAAAHHDDDDIAAAASSTHALASLYKRAIDAILSIGKLSCISALTRACGAIC